ncbi:MAG: hypothetical protein ABIT37_07535 [Luteolibacter sp.]
MDLLSLLKIAAAISLVVLIAGIGWAVTHLARIKREMIADAAMPKPAPARRILILIIAVLIAFVALLTGFLFYH